MRENLDLKLTPYNVLATGSSQGKAIWFKSIHRSLCLVSSGVLCLLVTLHLKSSSVKQRTDTGSVYPICRVVESCTEIYERLVRGSFSSINRMKGEYSCISG